MTWVAKTFEMQNMWHEHWSKIFLTMSQDLGSMFVSGAFQLRHSEGHQSWYIVMILLVDYGWLAFNSGSSMHRQYQYGLRLIPTNLEQLTPHWGWRGFRHLEDFLAQLDYLFWSSCRFARCHWVTQPAGCREQRLCAQPFCRTTHSGSRLPYGCGQWTLWEKPQPNVPVDQVKMVTWVTSIGIKVRTIRLVLGPNIASQAAYKYADRTTILVLGQELLIINKPKLDMCFSKTNSYASFLGDNWSIKIKTIQKSHYHSMRPL